jgi:hypothetical protein
VSIALCVEDLPDFSMPLVERTAARLEADLFVPDGGVDAADEELRALA